jgi:hypothetical protein
MVTFHIEPKNYRYRVVGLAFHEGHLFLQKCGGTWQLPTCTLAPEQPARATLHTLLTQTLQTDIRIERLLWIVEHIYDWYGETVCECTFCFLVIMPIALHSFPLDTPVTWWRAPDDPITFRWAPRERLQAEWSVTEQCVPSPPGIADSVARIAYHGVERCCAA